MVEIKYYPLSYFDNLSSEWHDLESGDEMSYFQTVDWFSSILPYVPKDCRKYESRLVLLEVDGAPKIVAPIWVVKKNFCKVNEAGIFLLGRGGWSDYLNFIYKDATKDDFLILLRDISQHYGINSFYFEEIPDSSTLYGAITDFCKVDYSFNITCLEIPLTENVDDYQDALSKHTKQNLRTANNRLAKGGLEIRFDLDDRKVNKEECCRMREMKLKTKKERDGWWQEAKLLFFDFFRIKFSYGLPLKVDKNSHLMTAYINGELAAFFNYGIDGYHNRVVIMAAGTSQKYAWYSPGMLLAYQFITSKIEEGITEVVDFTRGDEKYKYSLGGAEHMNHHIKFHIK